ncbi:MAG: hypothetical protein ACM3UZ_00760 [Acidobacteriota bacterium]
MEGGKDFKLGMAIAAFVITLALSLGGFQFYKSVAVAQPLVKSLNKVQGVTSVNVDDKKVPVLVTVTFKNPIDLKNSYTSVEEMVKNRFPDKAYVIKTADVGKSPELAAFYDSLELSVYEGIANNSFMWLNNHIAIAADKPAISFRLQVDENNLYLELVKNGQSYCKVIKRGKVQQDPLLAN